MGNGNDNGSVTAFQAFIESQKEQSRILQDIVTKIGDNVHRSRSDQAVLTERLENTREAVRDLEEKLRHTQDRAEKRYDALATSIAEAIAEIAEHRRELQSMEVDEDGQLVIKSTMRRSHKERAQDIVASTLTAIGTILAALKAAGVW